MSGLLDDNDFEHPFLALARLSSEAEMLAKEASENDDTDAELAYRKLAMDGNKQMLPYVMPKKEANKETRELPPAQVIIRPMLEIKDD